MFKKVVEIFYKVRKYGIIGSSRIIIKRLYNFCGAYFRLMKLIFAPTSFQKKRILGIWDYKALPWSIGDPLVFIEVLSILKIKHSAEEIDICVIYDRDNPGGNRREINLTPDNVQDYMLEFLPLFSTCPYLGSIYQFNSRKELYYFLKSNSERYDIFPPLVQHLGEKYNYHGDVPHLNEIQEFYKTYGYVPYLRIGERESSWARWFYLNYLPEKTVPVTLSLRQPLSDLSERNADPAVWLSFIDKCKTDFPEVVFVVVGLREEVFDGLRERSNVIIGKDFGTSIIEDLALIRTSFLYMGTTSGVNTIACFSDLPYLVFQWPLYDSQHKWALKPGEKFCFATNTQKIFSSTILVTPKLLLDEFKKLHSKLDLNKWLNITFEKACNKHGLPSAVVRSERDRN